MTICGQSMTESPAAQATPRLRGLFHCAVTVVLALSAILVANAQEVRNTNPAAPSMQSFALTDTNDLGVSGGKAEVVEYQG
jgi:hypothetical protein